MRLGFDDGSILEVYPDSSAAEDWRLILFDEDEDFVVAGGTVA
jgi:hypothetical protein